MDLYTLNHQIKSNMISNLYVFAGEETGLMKVYINQISKRSNKPVEYIDTVMNVYQRITRSALVGASKMFIVMDDKSFLKAEKLWHTLQSNLKGNILLLMYTKADKRSKFFKEMDYVPFNPLVPEVLAKYIMKVVPLSEASARGLATVCECSYNRCLQEADKINAYVSYRQSINDPITADLAYRLLLNDHVIYQPVGDVTFEIVDSIMNRNNVKLIEQNLIKMKTVNEPRLLLLSLLYNNFRNLFLYQECTDKNNVEQLTGLTKMECNIARNRMGRYSDKELLRAMHIIQDLESGVKLGKIDEAITIDYLVAQII